MQVQYVLLLRNQMIALQDLELLFRLLMCMFSLLPSSHPNWLLLRCHAVDVGLINQNRFIMGDRFGAAPYIL